MEVKRIVPIIVGALSAGAAAAAFCEIQRLKKMVSAGEEYMKKQDDRIRSLDEGIKKKDEEIVELNVVIDEKDEMIALQEEMIALHEEAMSLLKNSQELAVEPESDTSPSSLPEDSSRDPEATKKGKKNSPEYIFQYDSDMKLVAKYETISEACDSVGLKYPSSISKVLRGQAYTAAGYFWSKGYRPLRKFPAKWIELSKNMKHDKN